MARSFAITDIHGCSRTFINLIENSIQLKKEDHLFLLGDTIDRGPDSKGVIDYILRLKALGFNLTCLRGNHEEMLLKSFTDDEYLELFLKNGGDKTFKSFKISRGEELDDKYKIFFQSTIHYAIQDHFILVHAGINFNSPKPLEDLESMMWLRKFDAKNNSLNKIVVHGHTPVSLIEIQDQLRNIAINQKINLDNGCVFGLNEFYGNLCCLELETLKMYVQPNIDMKPLF